MPTNTKNKLSMLGLIIWVIAAVFFMYEFFLRTFIGSVAHQVIPDLHLNAETFAILGSAYYVAYAAMQIPVGILLDKFGVKLTLAFATLLCGLATLWFAHSTGFTSAFISRILMGLGSAFAFVSLLVIVMTWFPHRYFGSFAGVSQFVGTMGPLFGAGPLIALMNENHESWRMALTSVAVAGLSLFILVVIIVKNKPRGAKQQLIFLELSTPVSQRLLKLFKNKQAWVVSLYSATIYISIALLGAIWGTEYLQAKGMPQNLAADMISISWLGYAIGCPLTGVVSDLIKRRKPVLLFCAALGIIVTVFIISIPYTRSLLVFGLLFFGLGLAAAGQNIGFAIMSEHVDRATRATALGLNNAAIMLTGAIVPPVVSYFINLHAHGSSHLVAKDFTAALMVMPILCSVAFITAMFFIRETFCKSQKDKIVLQLDT